VPLSSNSNGLGGKEGRSENVEQLPSGEVLVSYGLRPLWNIELGEYWYRRLEERMPAGM
jgi:hypothetical protein